LRYQIDTLARVTQQSGLGTGASGALAAHANSAAGNNRRHDLAASHGTIYGLVNTQAGLNGATPLGGADYGAALDRAAGDAQGATDLPTMWKDRGSAFQSQVGRHRDNYQEAFDDYKTYAAAHAAAVAVGDVAGANAAQAQMNDAVRRAQEAETILTGFGSFKSYGTTENQGIFDDIERSLAGTRMWLGSVDAGDTNNRPVQLTDPTSGLPLRQDPGGGPPRVDATGLPAIAPAGTQAVSALDAAKARAPRPETAEEIQRRSI